MSPLTKFGSMPTSILFCLPYHTSQSTAALSAVCKRCRLLLSLIRGQESTKCDNVQMLPKITDFIVCQRRICSEAIESTWGTLSATKE